MQGLKYAPFPVVSALAGKALGGGCELLLHSDAIQAHANSFPGLVEPAVGLVPAWGGCTQMLMRQSFPVVRHVPNVFQNIARCRVANSIDEAREMKILRAGDGITMNRARVLADAKARCLEMANGLLAAQAADRASARRRVEADHRRQGRCAGAQRQDHRARCGRLQSVVHRTLRREYQYDTRAQRSSSCSSSSAPLSWSWSRPKRRSSASTIWWNTASRSGSRSREGLNKPLARQRERDHEAVVESGRHRAE